MQIARPKQRAKYSIDNHRESQYTRIHVPDQSSTYWHSLFSSLRIYYLSNDVVREDNPTIKGVIVIAARSDSSMIKRNNAMAGFIIASRNLENDYVPLSDSAVPIGSDFEQIKEFEGWIHAPSSVQHRLRRIN